MQWTKGSNSSSTETYPDEKTWSPDGPSELVGKLLVKKTVNRDDGPVTLLKIENGEGVWNVWCSRKALRDLAAEFDEQLIPGRVIGLKTPGKVKIEGTGHTFFPYELGFDDGEDIPKAKGAVLENDLEPF